MQRAPLPPNENERLEALRQMEVLDTDPEAAFDRLTDLAAKLCKAPIALITLVDVNRQWFKSHFGLEVAETPRDVAFCAHAILQQELMIVPDAQQDERFADNPLVTSDPKIRFYAGSPLVTHDGNAIGTFCVIDSVPRNLEPNQIAALKALSQHATLMLELRRTKELLRTNAELWDRASAAGDTDACSKALEMLGSNLQRMIRTRELSEGSIRELERSLEDFEGEVAGPGIRFLLDEVIEGAGRLVTRLGADHALLEDAIRIRTSAERARNMIAGNGTPD